MKAIDKKRFLLVIGSILFLTSCMPGVALTQTASETNEVNIVTQENTHDSPIPLSMLSEEGVDYPWWNDSVFYEIFVRSFKDSDGDGIGDFQGIIQQLDYLNDGDPNTHDDLGIRGIWLMPIFPSPSYHGYDVTDYFDVNPEYGTMDDFKQLLTEAHKRGIYIIVDLVINHTSNQHPWFKAALDPESEYHDWYVWSDSKPSYPGPWGQGVWHRASNGLYYYGVFWSGMPDLNFDNPAVSGMMLEASRFWLEDVGIDGFRVDAARYLYAEGVAQADTSKTLAWFREWRPFYKAINPEAFSVGEVWTDLQSTTKYGGGDGLDSLFIFDLSEDILNAVFAPNPTRITESYLDTLAAFPDLQFSTFLTNHDQQRTMSFYQGRTDKAKMAAFIYLTGPGVPFIYYGEEIGMTGNKPDEKLRTPMQWSSEKYAGFSSKFPWIMVNMDYKDVNVSIQAEDPDSLLNLYRTLVAIRNEHEALRTGVYLPLESNNKSIYATLRVSPDEILLVLVNLGKDTLSDCQLSLAESPLRGSYAIEAIFGEGSFESVNVNAAGAIIKYTIAERLDSGEMLILNLSH